MNSLKNSAFNQSKNNKRKLEEMSNSDQSTIDTNALKSKDNIVDSSDDLWSVKYAPKSLDELIIQKPKIQEFEKIMISDNVKLMIFTGPSGCGKNTLIDLYCQKHNIQKSVFQLESESKNYNFLQDNGIYQAKVGNLDYPEDLESLIYFINSSTLSAQGSVSGTAKTGLKTTLKLSSFNTKPNRMSHADTEMKSEDEMRPDNNLQQIQLNRKILVINSVPQCLSLFSARRRELLKDFQTCLLNVLNRQTPTPLIIITFSDQAERSKAFLLRIFGKEILNFQGNSQSAANSQTYSQQNNSSPYVQQFAINSPHEKSIDKVLKQIVFNESIYNVADSTLTEIRDQSNKDLRNAINTMQFKLAGKKAGGTNVQATAGKKLKPNTKKRKNTSDDEEFMMSDTQLQKVKGLKKQNSNQDLNVEAFEKDNNFSIFHGLGKFLYNKRENPVTGKNEQMSPSKMKSENKPKLYYEHQKIINKMQIESQQLGLYLHQNIPEFFNDIGDLANCFDIFSLTDYLENSIQYSFDSQLQVLEFQQHNALFRAKATTECNFHVVNPKTQQLFPMQKPQYYDFVKNYKENKSQMNYVAKEEQILSQKFVSEDLLIRSNKECVKNIFPYLKQMHHQLIKPIEESISFQVSGFYGNNNYQGGYKKQNFKTISQPQDEEKDDFFKQQEFEEKEKQLFRPKSKFHGKQSAMIIEQKSHFKGFNPQIIKPSSIPYQSNISSGSKEIQQIAQSVDDMQIDFDQFNDDELDELLGNMSLEEEISDSD
eukprot:403357582